MLPQHRGSILVYFGGSVVAGCIQNQVGVEEQRRGIKRQSTWTLRDRANVEWHMDPVRQCHRRMVKSQQIRSLQEVGGGGVTMEKAQYKTAGG